MSIGSWFIRVLGRKDALALAFCAMLGWTSLGAVLFAWARRSGAGTEAD